MIHNGGWDPQYILSNLTQVDEQATHTLYEGSRCGASSLLAVHIQSGSDAVRAVARDAYGQLRNVAELDGQVLADILALGTQHPVDLTFRHLSSLQEGLYIIANTPDNADNAEQGDMGAATSQTEMDRLDLMGQDGYGGVRPAGWFDSSSDAERGTTGQAAALNLPLPGGRQEGASGLDTMAHALLSFRNVGYVLAVPVPGQDPHGSLGHGITFGVDSSGRVYAYDPWPREGSQLMQWSSDRAEIEQYCQGLWAVMDRVGGATGAEEMPLDLS